MPDREKVIKALEYCKTTLRCDGGCPYADDSTDDCPMYDDALALLRAVDNTRPLDVERIVQKPKWMLDRLHHYKCSACGAQWGRALNMNYCPTCGQYMEGRDPDDWRYAQDAEEDEE